MSRRNLAWLLGMSALAVLGLAVSYSAPPREKDKDYELVRLMVEVLNEVDHRYVQELDDERKRQLVEDMINGGLERLDPHSAYINEQEYRQFTNHSKGKFGGIGIQVSSDRGTGVLTVISPMVGTPAYEAGVLAGDLIIKIDGKPTDTMRMSEAVEMIQGEPGEKVVLTVLHEGSQEPEDIEIVRAEIEVPSVMGDVRKPDNPKEWEFFLDQANKIAYIRLVAFSETARDELQHLLEQLEKEGMRGLILDLRNNPGGLLRSAVEITNLFLPEGRIVSTRGRNHREETYDAEPKKALPGPARDVPLVILVNKYSASASEIVAAALQDHGRAVIIGERTYGKGSVQNVIEMEGGQTALKLTTASYWRPSGKNIHRFPDSEETDEWGVKPNEGFEVTLTDEERLAYLRHRRDRDIVHGKPGHSSPPEAKPEKEKDEEKKPFVDRVLEKALEHLRGEARKAEARVLPGVVHT